MSIYWTTGVFVAVTAAIAAVGMLAARRGGGDADDYLLAGRSMPPWLAALSAIATNNSGYMFLGQIGLSYAIGVRSVWLAVGWIMGDLFIWFTVYPRIRRLARTESARSIPSLVAGSGGRGAVRLLAVLVFAFLIVYAAAQLRASSKALEGMLGIPSWAGSVFAALLVLAYSYSGGIRASIWTDALQSFVMIASLSALVCAGLVETGGATGVVRALREADPALISLFPADVGPSFALWILGWLGGGLGVVGQPTIVVRMLTLREDASLVRTGCWYFGFFAPFYALTIVLGFIARARIPTLTDPEMAMPTLAVSLLNPAMVGLLVAGVFAATMSTADSQILACTAALTEDLPARPNDSIVQRKAATAGITLLALGLALVGPRSVFAMVLHAWAALATTVGVATLGRTWLGPLRPRALWLSVVVGLVTVVAFEASGITAVMYEVLPGMVAGFCVLLADRWLVRSVRVGQSRAPAVAVRAIELPGEVREDPPH